MNNQVDLHKYVSDEEFVTESVEHHLQGDGILFNDGVILQEGDIVEYARKMEKFSLAEDHEGLLDFYFETAIPDYWYELCDDIIINSCIGRTNITSVYAHALEQVGEELYEDR